MRAGAEPPVWRRSGAAIWMVGFLALAAVLAFAPVATNDIWLHLKIGDLIRSEGAVPGVERFSFTAAGRPLVAHEWGAAVVFSLVHALGGVSGLIALKGLLGAAAFAAAVRTARAMGARLAVVSAPLLVAMVLVGARLLERPHLWTFLLAPVALGLLDRHRRRGGRAVWLLVPLQAVWANLHGGFVLGWALAGCYLAAAAWGFARERIAGRPARPPLRLALVVAALPLASLLNPAGWRLLALPFALTGASVFMDSVYEWLPTFSPVFRRTYLFREYAGLAGFALGGLLLRLPWAGRWLVLAGAAALLGGAAAGWTALLGAGVAIAAIGVGRGRGSVPLAHGLVILGTLALSARMNRMVADFALVTLAPAAALWDRWLRRARPAAALALRRRPGAAAAAGGMLLAAGALAIAAGGYPYGPASRRAAGAGVRDAPVGAVAFLEREGIGGRAFASYNAAAYLVWKLYPRVRVFVDSRNEAYPEEIFREYLAATRGGEAFDATLDRHRIDLALLTLRPHPPLDMTATLDARPDFALVYFDDDAAVYVRDVPAHRDLIRRRAYRYLSALSLGRRRIDAASAGAAAGEARRALQDCAQCLVARAALAEAAFARGSLPEAADRFGDLARRSPDLYLARVRLGDIRALQGRRTEAIAHYREALRIAPGDDYASSQLRALVAGGGISVRPLPSPGAGPPAEPAPGPEPGGAAPRGRTG